MCNSEREYNDESYKGSLLSCFIRWQSVVKWSVACTRVHTVCTFSLSFSTTQKIQLWFCVSLCVSFVKPEEHAFLHIVWAEFTSTRPCWKQADSLYTMTKREEVKLIFWPSFVTSWQCAAPVGDQTKCSVLRRVNIEPVCEKRLFTSHNVVNSRISNVQFNRKTAGECLDRWSLFCWLNKPRKLDR